MTRSCAQLMAWAHAQPLNALLFITLEEARQFMIARPWDRPYKPSEVPSTLNGRLCIISDLPPNHYLSTDGKVLPL